MFSSLRVQTRRQWRRHALKQPLTTSSLIKVALQHNNMHVRDIGTNAARKSAVVFAVWANWDVLIGLKILMCMGKAGHDVTTFSGSAFCQFTQPVRRWLYQKISLWKLWNHKFVLWRDANKPLSCKRKAQLQQSIWCENTAARKRGLTLLHLLQTYHHFNMFDVIVSLFHWCPTSLCFLSSCS